MVDKLSISTETGERIGVMFNPNTYTIKKTVSWIPSGGGASTDARGNAPTLTFGGGGARELTLELFFDVTEAPAEDPDVRAETDRIVRLTRIMRDKNRPRPPICTVDWGGATTEDFPFQGMVSDLQQRFTLFHASGRPLRAILNVTFIEFLNRTDDPPQILPNVTTHTVRGFERDKLYNIAHRAKLDVTRWRELAAVNNLVDPLNVPAGIVLVVPKVL